MYRDLRVDVRGGQFRGHGGLWDAKSEWFETFLELPHGIPKVVETIDLGHDLETETHKVVRLSKIEQQRYITSSARQTLSPGRIWSNEPDCADLLRGFVSAMTDAVK